MEQVRAEPVPELAGDEGNPEAHPAAAEWAATRQEPVLQGIVYVLPAETK
jgi:hypothetical protein